MKPKSPDQISRRSNRAFPVTDYNYRSLGFSGFNTRCAGSPQSSFDKISQDYFATEARHNFVAEALFFVLIIATTVPAILDCGRALLTFGRAIGGM